MLHCILESIYIYIYNKRGGKEIDGNPNLLENLVEVKAKLIKHIYIYMMVEKIRKRQNPYCTRYINVVVSFEEAHTLPHDYVRNIIWWLERPPFMYLYLLSSILIFFSILSTILLLVFQYIYIYIYDVTNCYWRTQTSLQDS